MLISWFQSRRRNVFYGWWIVGAALVTMTLSMGLFYNGFGFYFEPMRRQFQWSRTVLSGAFSFSRLESGFLGPIEGYLIQRFGPQKVMLVGFIIFALGFVLLSQVNSVLTFYMAFAVMALGSGIAGFSAVVASINNWFRRNRGKALGTAMLGLGLGGVIFSPVLAGSVSHFGWQKTALGSALLLLILGIPLSRVVRFSPEPYGYLPDGDKPCEKDSDSDSLPEQGKRNAIPVQQYGNDFTVREALRTPAFWLMSTGHALALVVISSIGLHQVPFMETDLGFSKASAAQVLVVLSGVAMLSQPVGGFLGDRYSKELLAAATLVGHCVAMLLLAAADSYSQMMLYAVIQGMAWGIRGPILTSMRGDYFGRKSFAIIMGFSQVIMMLGMIVGPIFIGFMADNYSYKLGFFIIGVVVGAGSVLFLFTKKPQPKAQPIS